MNFHTYQKKEITKAYDSTGKNIYRSMAIKKLFPIYTNMREHSNILISNYIFSNNNHTKSIFQKKPFISKVAKANIEPKCPISYHIKFYGMNLKNFQIWWRR